MDKKTQIVILDAYPSNPGDLSWDALAALGNLTIYEHCPNDTAEVVKRCADAEIVLTNKVRFSRDLLERLPKLKYISVLATGYNIIDIHAARELGITVSNVPSYSTFSVAQLAFSLLLELKSGVSAHDRAVKNGDWCKAPDFTFYIMPLEELAGKTLGIFGFGAIGQTVGRIGVAFGMKVIYYSRTRKQTDFAEYVSLEDLFRRSDVLSLHAPETPETSKLVNAERLSMMKSSAVLINTARGGLVDSQALADALNSGKIAGAGLDVLEQEPPNENHPLLHTRNCILTPHIAWGTHEARARLLQVQVENVKSYLAGQPINVVNP